MLALYSDLNKIQYGSRSRRRRKVREKKKHFVFKYEPYMDNMDVVSTFQSRYF